MVENVINGKSNKCGLSRGSNNQILDKHFSEKQKGYGGDLLLVGIS